MSYILIETADRETGVLQFETLEEARQAMYESFEEVLGYCYTNIKDIMRNVNMDIKMNGYYEDEECGLNEYGGWINRHNGGQLDWSIHEIKNNCVQNFSNPSNEVTNKYYDILLNVLKMKATQARDDWEQNWEQDDGLKEGFVYGLEEAVRTIQNSKFLISDNNK